jgi:hypothetical protein
MFYTILPECLEDNSYVRVLFMDYSRAFDTTNRELLIRKLRSFDMLSNVIRWIANSLTGRIQAVFSDRKLSS